MLSLGIDLSEEKIDLTLLSDSIRGPRLRAKARFYLPQGGATAAERRQYCAQKLRQFIQENKAGKAEIVVGLPRRHFLVRNLTIPTLRPEDVNSFMRYEADRHVPFGVGSIYYDTLAPENPQGAATMEIVFVAIRRATMDELLEPLRLAGVQPSIVDVSTFSSVTAYLDKAARKEKLIAFVEIGEATVILSIVAEGRFRSSRAYALNQLMEKTQEESLSPTAALASGISRELELLLHSASMEPGEKKFEHLVVSGAGASNPELVADLEYKTKLEALLYAPLGQKQDLSAEEAADMSRATSLALRGLSRAMKGLNLAPIEQRHIRRDYGPSVAAVFVAFLVVELCLMYGHSLYVRRLQVEALTQRVEELKPYTDKINDLKAEVELLESQAGSIQTIADMKPPCIEVLAALTQQVPASAWIESFNLQNGNLKLRVRSDPGVQIAQRISESPYFRDVKLVKTERDVLDITAVVQVPELTAEEGVP